MPRFDWCQPNGGTEYITTKPIEWHVGKKNSGLIITVPSGFKFESSVPRVLWLAFSPHDPFYLWAACIHDWLLENAYRPAFAAGEWYDGAMKYGAPKWKTKLAHIGIFKHTVR
tara:strand:- start:178 stop:516 length:339 start_codon:yes stop_codon:yes gene_type:complete